MIVPAVWALLLAATAGFAAGNPPLVWFSPLVPGNWPDGRAGQVDYLDLFNPAAPWASAASRVQVFKIVPIFTDTPGALTDSQWRQVFADLDRRGIALAMDWGPLSSMTCGRNVEGFTGSQSLAKAQKIKSLGGNLRYLAMDEPFYYANIYSGPDACRWTPKQIAVNAVQNLAQIRSVFPNVVVGDEEPTPALGVPDWVQRYAAWLDAWKEAAGVPLAFFHFDVDYPASPN